MSSRRSRPERGPNAKEHSQSEKRQPADQRAGSERTRGVPELDAVLPGWDEDAFRTQVGREDVGGTVVDSSSPAPSEVTGKDKNPAWREPPYSA